MDFRKSLHICTLPAPKIMGCPPVISNHPCKALRPPIPFHIMPILSRPIEPPRKSYRAVLPGWPCRHVNAQNQRPGPSPKILALAVFRAFSRAWKCAKCWCRQHFCVSAKCRNLLSSGSLLSLTVTVYAALLQLTTVTKYCEGQ